MIHKQETVEAARVQGKDRAKGAMGPKGEEARFWRVKPILTEEAALAAALSGEAPEENEDGVILEEILADGDALRRFVAPDDQEIDLGEHTPQAKEAHLADMVERAREQFGELPFYFEDNMRTTFRTLQTTLIQSLGLAALESVDIEEWNSTPAFRRVNVIEDVDLNTGNLPILKDGIFTVRIKEAEKEQSGTYVNGEFVPDETLEEVAEGKSKPLEDALKGRSGLRFKADLLDEMLALVGLDENLDEVPDPEAEVEEGVEEFQYVGRKIVATPEVTQEILDFLSANLTMPPNILVRPRAGRPEDWVWGYIWEKSGSARWHFIGDDESLKVFGEIEYLGTERPDNILEEWSHVFDPINIFSNSLAILEEEGFDLAELGYTEEQIERGRKNNQDANWWRE